jgi:hypothetical protein
VAGGPPIDWRIECGRKYTPPTAEKQQRIREGRRACSLQPLEEAGGGRAGSGLSASVPLLNQLRGCELRHSPSALHPRPPRPGNFAGRLAAPHPRIATHHGTPTRHPRTTTHYHRLPRTATATHATTTQCHVPRLPLPLPRASTHCHCHCHYHLPRVSPWASDVNA